MASSRNLDVHQLTALDHLLRERSVTAAARRLGISQPAASSLLAKLRRHFGDELLVRREGGYGLTPVGALLAERTPATLAQVRALLDVGSAFDPATSEREFRLITSDHFTSVYAGALVRRAQREAPRSTFRFAPISPGAPETFRARLLEVDGLVLPRASVPDLPFVDVATDEWSFVACRTNPVAATGLELSDLASSPFVLFRVEPGGLIPPVAFLHSQGLELRAEVQVGDFASIPFLVGGTSRIGLVPRRLAEMLAPASRTVVLESPVLLPALMVSMLWHPAHEPDLGHAWLRSTVASLTLP